MADIRILIVEDSPAMRMLMGRAVARLPGVTGFDEAADGAEALRKLQSTTYALVIVDINIPVLDGLKLIERIRASDKTRDAKVIVVTTDSAESDRKRAMDLGADAYLLKPIQLADLTAAIEQALLDR